MGKVEREGMKEEKQEERFSEGERQSREGMADKEKQTHFTFLTRV